MLWKNFVVQDMKWKQFEWYLRNDYTKNEKMELSESHWNGGIMWHLRSCRWGESLTGKSRLPILIAENTLECVYMLHCAIYFPFNTKSLNLTSKKNENKILYFTISVLSMKLFHYSAHVVKNVENKNVSILSSPPLNPFFPLKNSSILH